MVDMGCLPGKRPRAASPQFIRSPINFGGPQAEPLPSALWYRLFFAGVLGIRLRLPRRRVDRAPLRQARHHGLSKNDRCLLIEAQAFHAVRVAESLNPFREPITLGEALQELLRARGLVVSP